MEKEHCNKRFAVRLGDDGIRNESTNRKLAQTYGSLLRDTKIRCNGAAGTANDGQNIVIEKSDIIVNNDRNKKPLSVPCNAMIGACIKVVSIKN